MRAKIHIRQQQKKAGTVNERSLQDVKRKMREELLYSYLNLKAPIVKKSNAKPSRTPA